MGLWTFLFVAFLSLSPLTATPLGIWYKYRSSYALSMDPSPLSPMFDNPTFQRGYHLQALSVFQHSTWPQAISSLLLVRIFPGRGWIGWWRISFWFFVNNSVSQLLLVILSLILNSCALFQSPLDTCYLWSTRFPNLLLLNPFFFSLAVWDKDLGQETDFILHINPLYFVTPKKNLQDTYQVVQRPGLSPSPSTICTGLRDMLAV